MNIIRKLATIIALLTVVVGCQKEIPTLDNGTKDFGTDIELKMNAAMSDVVIPTSKALTTEGESAIIHLDVLVFDASDKFVYTVQANAPTVTGNNLSYTVRLKKSINNEPYKLVLLANLDATAATKLKSITVSTAKEAALASIIFTPNTDWTTGSAIPMWADYPTAAVISTNTTASNFGTTTLIRSLARINVTNTATTFQLTAVWVYNSANKAVVAPLPAKFNGSKVTAPTIPTSIGVLAAYSKAGVSDKVERDIYVGESAKQALGSGSAFCLVLKGTYAGASNFYRVDMVDSNGKTVLDILRNHTYDVKITKVGGSGYPTQEAAFASLPINMTTEIKVWDDAKLNDITTDGQYTLAVDKGSVALWFASGTESLNYYTDYPTGATVTANSANNWITITSSNVSPIRFSYTKNSSTVPRTGSITIAAGRISKKITIEQAEYLAYVGMFGGQLWEVAPDVWAFSKPLYVQTSDQSHGDGAPWDNANSGVMNTSLWNGRSNTYTLKAPNFVAAHLCFNKNTPEQQASAASLVWYLPAQEQLMGIWATHTGSGALFHYDTYWSSSEYNDLRSWYTTFYNGGTGDFSQGDKGTRVRCVREVAP